MNRMFFLIIIVTLSLFGFTYCGGDDDDNDAAANADETGDDDDSGYCDDDDSTDDDDDNDKNDIFNDDDDIGTDDDDDIGTDDDDDVTPPPDPYEDLTFTDCPLQKVTVEEECSATPTTTSCAIRFMYEGFKAFTVEQTDEDCSGSPIDCWLCAWGESNELLAFKTDTECDDEYNQAYILEYDDNGKIIKEFWDNDYNGEPDFDCTEYVWADTGNSVKVSRDIHCDGEYSECTTYTYNETGVLMQKLGDPDCDDAVDFCTLYEYETDGALIAEKYAVDCESEPTVCINFGYNEFGAMTSSETDNDCDGAADSNCVTYSRNEDTTLSGMAIDADCDNLPDTCYSYSYE